MAVTFHIVDPITLEAAADHSANQYRFVTCNSSGQAALAGAGLNAVGVLQNADANAVGKACTVVTDGVTKVRAGAAVTAGAKVMSNATGLAVTATATNHVCGTALTAAAGANEYIVVKLAFQGILA